MFQGRCIRSRSCVDLHALWHGLALPNLKGCTRETGVTNELEPAQRRWRNKVPQEHRASLDTRIVWLWNQRFGTVQSVYKESPDILDTTAATLILQAVLGRDMKAVQQLFTRIEGGSVYDEDLAGFYPGTEFRV